MILDTLENIGKYADLNPLFAKVVEFIKENNLNSLSAGVHKIVGDDLFVNIQEAKAKSRQDAKLESHRRMIDIQIPISGTEEHGWSPLSSLNEAPYDETNDISFYGETPQAYYNVKPGQMVIYFPEDGHAPAITPTTLKKAIFKVKC